MGITFQISNGDLYINPATGSSKTIDGLQKVSQDVAEAILLDFNVERNYGNDINPSGKQTGSAVIGVVSPIDIKARIHAAIERLRRLQIADEYLTDDEEIITIKSLQVEFSDSGTTVNFFLELVVRSGKLVTQQGAINLKPTSLSHVDPKGLFTNDQK